MISTAIDIGNSRIKIGSFDKSELVELRNIPSDPLTELYRILSGHSMGDTILSSTKEVPDHLVSYLRSKARKFIHLSSETRLPIKIDYRSPDTLGPDRIALAVAGHSLFPRAGVLVISLGTAITYNFISKKGSFIGGAISPGISMRFKALNSYTAKLPLVNPEIPESIIGTSSVQSILSGIVNGVVFEIQGFIKSIEGKYPGTIVVITGGDGGFLFERLSLDAVHEPDLALLGLYKILDFNVHS